MKSNYFFIALTYEQALSRHWQWIMDDIHPDKQSQAQKEQTINFLKDNHYCLAFAKDNADNDKVGIYLPLLPDLSINQGLTPETANSFGYKYLGDIIYDREAPFEAMTNVIKQVDGVQTQLGLPAQQSISNNYGLYQKTF